MKKFGSIFLSLLLCVSLSISAFAAPAISELGLESKTKAFLLGDFASGEVLEEYKIEDTLEIASLTKLLSYFVVADKIKSGELKANDHVTITAEDVSVEGTSFKTQPGQVYMVSELMEAMMIVSANDATRALARHISGTEEAFVELMRAKAQELGLLNAKVYNSTGLPTGEGHLQNHMTTRELFILTRALLNEHPDILGTTQKPFLIQSDRGYQEPNTNMLLGLMPQVDGLKTGYTEKAGACQITTGIKPGIDKQSEPIRFIAIIMGADTYDSRRDSSKALMEYGFSHYERRIIGAPNEALGNATFSRGTPYEAPYFAKEAKSVLAKVGENFETNVEFQQNRALPIPIGDSIGTVTFFKGDQEIHKTDVILKLEILPAGVLSLFHREFNKQLRDFGNFFKPVTE